jgi:hypothetical protein
MDLAYITESQDGLQRAWRKLQKLEARLPLNRNGTRYVKPKGMHWRTFNALGDRIGAAEEATDATWLPSAATLLARLSAPTDDLG